ncbi:MAG: putative transposase [Flavisolibacter sp.]
MKQMPQHQQYNALKKESRLFPNTVKMIGFRAETALFNLVKPYYNNNAEDGRMLLKQIFISPANKQPHYIRGNCL